jgi:hypothetical protein
VSEVLILGGVAAAVAAGVGVAYAVTRGGEKAPAPAPIVVHVPATRQPNPPGMAVPVVDTRYMQNLAAPQTYQPAQQGLSAWLQFGTGALEKLPSLASSLGGLVGAFNSGPAVVPAPTGDAAAAAATVQAGQDYNAFAQQYAATQVALDAAHQQAIAYEAGSGALATDGYYVDSSGLYHE